VRNLWGVRSLLNEKTSHLARIALLAAITASLAFLAFYAAFSASVPWQWNPTAPPRVDRDLSALRRDGVFRVAIPEDQVSLAFHRQRPEGLAYEMTEWIASELDLWLEVVPVHRAEVGLLMLRRGEVDLVAVADSGSAAIAGDIRWTRALDTTAPVVVGKGAASIASPADLDGRRLYVRPHSAHAALAHRWQEVYSKLDVVYLPAEITAQQIALGAIRGEWSLALMDEDRARLEKAVYSPLEISAPVDSPLPVRWALRSSAVQLGMKVDELVSVALETGRWSRFGERYESPWRLKSRRRPLFRASGSRLSPWDHLFREAGRRYGFDWRLLAALSFAESGYDPWEVSHRGAIGLLQLMPETARAFGAANPFDPAENVNAGAAHLKWLFDLYSDVEQEERLAFALAAYNMGMGHLADARRLAGAQGLDPDRWEGHVALVLPQLEIADVAKTLTYGRANGRVTLRYVDHVIALYRGFGGSEGAAQVVGEGSDLSPKPSAATGMTRSSRPPPLPTSGNDPQAQGGSAAEPLGKERIASERFLLYISHGDEMPRPASHATTPSAQVISRACLRAARMLSLSQKSLAAILGVSEASISRMERGRGIHPKSKEAELAAVFLRIFRSLDALVGGKTLDARSWLHAHNLHLQGTPAELMETVTGLVHVAEYLDGMRGKL